MSLPVARGTALPTLHRSSAPTLHPTVHPTGVASTHPTTCLVVGPAEHGVTAAALAQLEVLRGDGGGPVHVVRRPARPDPADLLAALRSAPAGPVLVHVTDRLFGANADEAADVLVALAAGLGPDRPLVLTLHDLPQASDGPLNHARRSAAYRRTAHAAARVVVASRHEQRLLAACGASVDAAVVPLPVPQPQIRVDLGAGAPAGADLTPAAVAVLGFLYPGKGHERVITALDVLPAGVGLLALGRPSDGHDDLVGDLSRLARAHGRRFTVTGYVPEADLTTRLRSAVLPVAPHEHLSASGSINTWIGAGRRPLVPRSDYVGELLERSPGCVQVYDDLREGLASAWADPASTWAAPSGPSVADTVALLRPVLAAARDRQAEVPA